MTGEPLTALELAVLAETCKQLPSEDRAALEQQIEGISVERRENTGAGFYTYFKQKSKSAQQIHADTRHCYVTAEIDGLENALGFILWTKDGYIDCLEGYTMTLNSTVGVNLTELDFELTSAPHTGPLQR